MQIKPNERVVVVGKTGSGKSFFIKKACLQFKKVIFVDPKCECHNDFNQDYCRIAYTPEEVFRIIDDNDDEYFILYQPQDLDENIFDNFCKGIFIRGNTTIFMDEVSFVCFPKTTNFHGKILRMGRSKGIGIWHLTQRPKYVDNKIFSEAEHFIIFRLKLKDDKDKLSGAVGEDINELMDVLDDYESLYYNDKNERMVLSPV